MKDKSHRPRIALFAKGAIAGGNLGYGIPSIRDLFDRLSEPFQVVLYSFSAKRESGKLKRIQVRQPRNFVPARLKSLWLAIRFIADHLTNPFDIVFAVSIQPAGRWALRLGKLIKRPVVVQIIGLEAVALPDIGEGNLSKPGLKEVTLDVCRRADVLVAVADYQKNIALKSFPFQREIRMLPLRIDAQRFRYRKRTITFPLQVIHIAYYSPIKDQDTMFRAFAGLCKQVDCRLTVIGSGYDVPALRTLLKDLEITEKITFMAEIDQAELLTQFDSKHILMHTARFETGCGVVQEAMASGVAVCGTSVGILSDLGEQFAVTVPPGDAELLTSRMLDLINDPVHFDEMTARAYHWITTHDAVWAYTHYHEFLRSLVKKD